MNNTQQMLHALLPACATHAFTSKKIQEQSGFNPHGANRMLSRLAKEQRVTREKRKDKETGEQVYHYYLTEAQRLRAEKDIANPNPMATRKKATPSTTTEASKESPPPTPQPPQTEIKKTALNGDAQAAHHAINQATQHTEAERQRLIELIQSKQKYLNTLRDDVDRLKKGENKTNALYRALREEQEALLSQLTGEYEVITLGQVVTHLEQLLTRPALKEDAKLKQILLHYKAAHEKMLIL